MRDIKEVESEDRIQKCSKAPLIIENGNLTCAECSYEFIDKRNAIRLQNFDGYNLKNRIEHYRIPYKDFRIRRAEFCNLNYKILPNPNLESNLKVLLEYFGAKMFVYFFEGFKKLEDVIDGSNISIYLSMLLKSIGKDFDVLHSETITVLNRIFGRLFNLIKLKLDSGKPLSQQEDYVIKAILSFFIAMRIIDSKFIDAFIKFHLIGKDLRLQNIDHLTGYVKGTHDLYSHTLQNSNQEIKTFIVWLDTRLKTCLKSLVLQIKADAPIVPSKFAITDTLYLKKENGKISVYLHNSCKTILNEYIEIIHYLKENCELDKFLNKIIFMEKARFFTDIVRHELDQKKIMKAIYTIKNNRTYSGIYAQDFGNLDLVEWFFQSVYFFRIDGTSLITLGPIFDYNPYEREEYIRNHGEKYLDYLERVYWITIKYKNNRRYDRPVFSPEGSLEKSVRKLKAIVTTIRDHHKDWEEVQKCLEAQKLTSYHEKFSQEINESNIISALNYSWKDIFQIGCEFQIDDGLDLEHLKYYLGVLVDRGWAIFNEKEGISYWKSRL